MADFIATYVTGRCYCHGGRWNDTVGMYQCIKVDVKTLLADVIAMGLTSLLVLQC